MLWFNSCGKKYAAPNVCKKDSHIILKRILKFPAQPSPFLGTMENIIFAISIRKSKNLKSDFFVLSSNLVLATERTKSRNRVDFGRFMSREGTETLILVFTSKTGQSVEHDRHRNFYLFCVFFCHREDIFRHFIGLILDSKRKGFSK